MTRNAVQTGKGTAPTNDVADPHPSDERQSDQERHPGGANPPKTDNSTNDAVHSGKAERPPPHVRRS